MRGRAWSSILAGHSGQPLPRSLQVWSHFLVSSNSVSPTSTCGSASAAGLTVSILVALAVYGQAKLAELTSATELNNGIFYSG